MLDFPHIRFSLSQWHVGTLLQSKMLRNPWQTREKLLICLWAVLLVVEALKANQKTF